MSEALYVTPAQVLAAKLALELNEEAGEPPVKALEAIANARVVAPQQSPPTTSADEQGPLESLATLQRIEHQLQVLSPEASEQERSQTPEHELSQPSDPTLALAGPRRPWDREEEEGGDPPLRQFDWYEDVEDVHSQAGEPEVDKRGGTPEGQGDFERTYAEYRRARERRYGAGSEVNEPARDDDLDPEGRDHDIDGPGSRGIDR